MDELKPRYLDYVNRGGMLSFKKWNLKEKITAHILKIHTDSAEGGDQEDIHDIQTLHSDLYELFKYVK